MLRIQEKVRRQDDGAVAIMVGIFLLTLVVFAAWAVDISAVLVERRADQAAADVGALSGAQFTAALAPAAGRAAAEAEVRRITAINIGATAAQWNTCTDSARPAEFIDLAPTTACISFTAGMTKMRVRVPDQAVPTNFAGVIGIDSINARAFAEVTVSFGDLGGILPFGLPPSASGPEVCVKAGAQNPCDPAQGNFGFLDFKRYIPGTPSSCNAGDLILNIAGGVDHLLETRDVRPSAITDESVCGNVNGRPDRAKSQTGNVQSMFNTGLVDGSAPLARLQRGSGPKTPALGQSLDDTPLWEFMTAGSGSCDIPLITDHELMIICLESSDVGSVRFDDDIISSPRWAFVPRIHMEFVGGGSQVYEIIAFVPIFIQTVYFSCTGGGGCKEFNPGETGPGGDSSATGMSAIIIPTSSLSTTALETFPDGEESVEYLLTR